MEQNHRLNRRIQSQTNSQPVELTNRNSFLGSDLCRDLRKPRPRRGDDYLVTSDDRRGATNTRYWGQPVPSASPLTITCSPPAPCYATGSRIRHSTPRTCRHPPTPRRAAAGVTFCSRFLIAFPRANGRYITRQRSGVKNSSLPHPQMAAPFALYSVPFSKARDCDYDRLMPIARFTLLVSRFPAHLSWW